MFNQPINKQDLNRITILLYTTPQGILSISQGEALPIGLITQQRNGKTMPWDRKCIQFTVPTTCTLIKYTSILKTSVTSFGNIFSEHNMPALKLIASDKLLFSRFQSVAGSFVDVNYVQMVQLYSFFQILWLR